MPQKKLASLPCTDISNSTQLEKKKKGKKILWDTLFPNATHWEGRQKSFAGLQCYNSTFPLVNLWVWETLTVPPILSDT